MKVYVTYENDCFDGKQIDSVFLNESDVRKYVTTEMMLKNSKTLEELVKMQEEQYDVYEVIEHL